MRYNTSRSIYSPASAGGEAKDSYMRAFVLTNELSRLEHEKKMASIKITTLEKRIEDVRNEIDSINSTLKDSNEAPERNDAPQASKKRHVTMEY